MDKIKKIATDGDESHHGYQRVEADDGTLTASNTSTSLDTVLLEPADPLSNQPARQISLPPAAIKQKSFGTIFEENELARSLKQLRAAQIAGDDKAGDSSEEDDFDERREHFQKSPKASSTVDGHKSILKDLKHLRDSDRRDFQSKKHVSLDLRHTRFLDSILKESSSDEEFKDNRQHFQARKHQSLDPKVKFKFDKEPQSSSDEDYEAEVKSLIREKRYDTNSIIIDLKDLSSEDEDLIDTRKNFQQQRQISIQSQKSARYFEMDELRKKDENLRNTIPFVRQITEDGKPMLEIYRPTTNPIYIYTQVLAALSVSMGSMVVGFASAYTSPALVSMMDRNQTSFDVDMDQASWVGGIMPLAGLAGGICGGPLIEYIGRKNTILGTAIPFIVSWLLIACATNVWMVLAGRALSGFCVGIASLSLPVYLGETVQPEVRGTLGLLPTAFGNIGILLCFVTGKYLDWSSLAFLGGALPVPFLILMFLIPETPRWYVSRNREDQARKALQWLRGRDADVDPELKGIVKSATEAERSASRNAMLDLLKRSNLKPLLISLGLMFFQQLSGINAVIFYTVTIFKDAGSSIDENLCTIIVGVVNFGAVFVATILIDRLGRKVLLYISDIAMIITLMTLGTFFYLKNNGTDVSNVGWLPLASFVVFVVGFSLGFGPIPWLMMGEILPGKIRGSAASVATAFNWLCTFIVTKAFVDLVETIGQHGAFWMFGSICCVGLFFIIFYVPETQGKSLEDIERKMMGRVRRMSSVANMKPLSFNM
uniref:Facilitated trehalose transporter Tret1 n=2 Tax=Nyssomyia neivai TaxID=330878 RepID=A0A1L8DF37_9DIPT